MVYLGILGWFLLISAFGSYSQNHMDFQADYQDFLQKWSQRRGSHLRNESSWGTWAEENVDELGRLINFECTPRLGIANELSRRFHRRLQKGDAPQGMPVLRCSNLPIWGLSRATTRVDYSNHSDDLRPHNVTFSHNPCMIRRDDENVLNCS